MLREPDVQTLFPVETPDSNFELGVDLSAAQSYGTAGSLPVNQLVLKISPDCNFRCNYCYVYNHGDNSWISQPKSMSLKTLRAAAAKVGEYVHGENVQVDNPPSIFFVTLHGGEPLLQRPAYLDQVNRIFRQEVDPCTNIGLGIQTNASLITPGHLDIFDRDRVRVSVSLDGGLEKHNAKRLGRNGEPTFDAIMRGLTLLRQPKYRRLFAGFLCYVDLDNDPIEVYESLRTFNPRNIDFLLPHGNWGKPPMGLETPEAREAAPYAKWLNTIFDAWYGRDSRYVRIRMFDSVLRTLIDERSSVESIGNNRRNNLLVVQTNGGWEMVDTLSTVPGRPAYTGLDVFRHSLEQANNYVESKYIQLGAAAVAPLCQECPVLEQCGRGYTPHRYGPTNLFNNPSVFCQDLSALISHIDVAARKLAVSRKHPELDKSALHLAAQKQEAERLEALRQHRARYDNGIR